MSDENSETRAIALVGQSLAFGLMARLVGKGVLSRDEAVQTIEGALATFEIDAPDVPEARIARQMLEAMANIAGLSKPPK